MNIGDTVPDIAMEKPEGSTVKPSDYRGKPLVMFFYPKDNTPGCTKENLAFTELKPEFDKAGVALLGISKDPPKKHVKFMEKHGLTVDLASDPVENGLSDALGIWKEKSMYGRTFMGMVRTTLLVGADGRIVRIWPKVKVAGHAEDVLEAARSL